MLGAAEIDRSLENPGEIMLTVGRIGYRWLLALSLCACAGCGGGSGPELFSVSGTVTLNGKPLPNAELIFQPKEGAPSYGKTDAEGYYELTYSRDRSGALAGSHTVSITTAIEDEDGNTAEELLPTKYNIDTELSAMVSDDSEPIDFKLDGEGKIIQAGEDDPDPDSQPVGNPGGEFN